jgi:hypothetical protein
VVGSHAERSEEMSNEKSDEKSDEKNDTTANEATESTTGVLLSVQFRKGLADVLHELRQLVGATFPK